MIGRNASGGYKTRSVPWAVLAIGLVLTGILYGSITKAIADRTEKEFQSERERISSEINGLISGQVAILNATAGAIAVDPLIGQKRFERFCADLKMSEDARIPAAIGLSVSRPWARRSELKEEAATRGALRFDFRPAGPRAEAHAVVLIDPLDAGNANAAGYDMHADATRRRAMDEARRLDAPVMTTKVRLAKDGAKAEPAVLIYRPVKDEQGRPVGLVYSGIRARDIFRKLFPVEDGSADKKADPAYYKRFNVGLRLWTGEPNADNLLYERTIKAEASLPRVETLELREVGQRLRAEFVMYPDFATPGVIRRWVFPVGITVSLLLFFLAFNLVKAKEASERRGAKQWLLGEVGRLTAGASDEEPVLATIAAEVARILNVVCRIDLLEPDGTVRTVSTRTTQREELADLERERPRMEYDAILRAALDTGETQRRDGYSSQDAVHQKRLDALDIGHVVIVPMQIRGRSLGAITMTRRRGRAALSNDAVALSEAIAGRIALAVDNARLYRAAQVEIVERTAAETEVRRLNDGLEEIVEERTRDLEASNHELESFCYSVSHDLRTPLRSLDGFSRALQEDYGDRLDEQGHDYIDRIRAATKRMDELITALLQLSRLTRREILPVEVDVTASVRELMNDLDPEGAFAFDVEEGLKAQADPRMFNVVFENLLSNAMKFSGRVEGPKIEVGRTEDGALYVRDNGAGFDMEYSAKLFQPFERLHSVREFPGHGIGLATVERIVKRHGGEVRAEGKPGEGATFYVRFPE